VVDEDTPPAVPTHDFLADVSNQWELAAAPIAALGIRTVSARASALC
jgi:NAD dependent epimerase/dehydratase family enzyme